MQSQTLILGVAQRSECISENMVFGAKLPGACDSSKFTISPTKALEVPKSPYRDPADFIPRVTVHVIRHGAA
jgi:hypothetical protein